MTKRQDVQAKAAAALEKKARYGADIDFSHYVEEQQGVRQAADPASLPEKQRETMASVGFEADASDRAASFMQIDHQVMQCQVQQEALELLSTSEAAKKYPELVEKYWWRAMAPDADKYTARTATHAEQGYFIRVRAGQKVTCPLQACMFISQEGLIQDVHNIIIVEPGAELDIISGCATDPDVKEGVHIGVSEIYIEKDAKLSFTMIHRWGEKVSVRPRTGTIVEENGVYLSNYICLEKATDVQMDPTTYLVGKGAVARINSIVVAPEGSNLDIGGRAIMDAENTRAELIARTISTGGQILNRGHLLGRAPNSKAHLECNGLLLNPKGVIHAIPELEARTDNAELSHEAAVGKIAPDEIEYLMARGLSEEEATATIVRGFLKVNIEGLPEALAAEIDKTLNAFSLNKGM